MKTPVPDTAFWIAERGRRPVFADSAGNQYGDAANAFYRVVELLCQTLELTVRKHGPRAERKVERMLPDINAFYPRGLYAEIRTATPDQEAALNALFKAVQAAVESAHAAGVERGKNLLMGLANGELSVAQVNSNALPKSADNDG